MEYAWVTSNADKVTVLQSQVNEANLNLPDIIQVEIDLREVLASPKAIVVCKACMAYEAMQNPDIGALVEDTTLHIFEEDGTPVLGWEPELVKFNIQRLSNYTGKRVQWVSHMAITNGTNVVWTYSSVEGVIVPYDSTSKGQGFDGYILPNGSEKVYGHMQQSIYNPRFANYLKLITAPDTCFIENFMPDIAKTWQGEWQRG